MVSAKFAKVALFAALVSVGAAQTDDTTTTDVTTTTDTTTTADETTTTTDETTTTTDSTTTTDTTTSDETTTTTSTTTTGSSSTSSSSSSSASASVTGGPALINEVPGGASTNSAPFIITGAAGLARRQGGAFIGGDSCTDATVFELNDGVLTAGGSPYGSGDNTNILFSQSPAAGGETSTWFINNGALGWFNTAFYNNQAGFCSAGGSLYITFETPAAEDYPAGCAEVSLQAIEASRCVDGVIVGPDNDNCDYPIGIPRSSDYFITGCPTPTGEVCKPTVVSWIAGSLNFL